MQGSELLEPLPVPPEQLHPVKLSTLQELTGSRNTQPAGFKRHCRTALEQLIAIGFLESYSIERDLVTVNRILPTPRLKSK